MKTRVKSKQDEKMFPRRPMRKEEVLEKTGWSEIPFCYGLKFEPKTAKCQQCIVGNPCGSSFLLLHNALDLDAFCRVRHRGTSWKNGPHPATWDAFDEKMMTSKHAFSFRCGVMSRYEVAEYLGIEESQIPDCYGCNIDLERPACVLACNLYHPCGATFQAVTGYDDVNARNKAVAGELDRWNLGVPGMVETSVVPLREAKAKRAEVRGKKSKLRELQKRRQEESEW